MKQSGKSSESGGRVNHKPSYLPQCLFTRGSGVWSAELLICLQGTRNCQKLQGSTGWMVSASKDTGNSGGMETETWSSVCDWCCPTVQSALPAGGRAGGRSEDKMREQNLVGGEGILPLEALRENAKVVEEPGDSRKARIPLAWATEMDFILK